MVQAQPYGNEWIDYSKTYHRIKIAKDGIVRVSFSALESAGLSSLPGSGFKVIHRGEEIPLYVTTSGLLANGDYLEFYGQKNDGEFDRQLHQQAAWQLMEFKSLFSDSISYYLTWDGTTTNQRYTNAANNVSSPPPAESYFMHTSLRIHNNIHFGGEPFRLGGVNNNYADFENGEGFVGSLIQTGMEQNYTVSTPAKYTGEGAPNASVEVKVCGRSDDFGSFIDHHTRIKVHGTIYVDNTFEAHKNVVMSNSVFLTDITTPSTIVTYQSVGDFSSIDNISAVYTALTYPRQFDFDNARNFAFTLEDNTAKYLEIENFNAGGAPVLYDLTNQTRIIPVEEAGVFKFNLQAGADPNVPRELFFSNTTSGLSITTISSLTPINFTNYAQFTNQGNYIIMTHPLLREGAVDEVQRYADYRASVAGGEYNVVIANIEELYDQYAWGIPKHPFAIRSFINDAINSWSIAPQYLFLLGKSVSYHKATNNPPGFEACLVPSYGQHASDNMLTVPNIFSYQPQIPVGRVSALTPTHVRDYLNKVIQYEAQIECSREARAWTKKVAHVVSSYTPAQTAEFGGYLDSYKPVIEGESFGGTVVGTYLQTSPPPVTAQPQFNQEFSNGLALVTLMGHSALGGTWNFDIKDDPTEYNNVGKYPLILSGSCFVGNIHAPSLENPSMAEAYVLAPQSGAIGFLATVSFGFPSFLHLYAEEYYNQMSIENYGNTLGFYSLKALQKMYIADPTDPFYEGVKITSEEYTLEGDPGVPMIHFDNPEFIIDEAGNNDITVNDPVTGTELTGNPIMVEDLEEIEFEVFVSNIGQAVGGTYTIQITRTFSDGTVVTVIDEEVPVPLTDMTYFFTVPTTDASLDEPDIFTVIVDAGNAHTEDCEDNNTASVSIQVVGEDCVGLTPPTIDDVATDLCTDSAPVTLSATPAGGTFVGAGVTGNTFAPSTGTGSYLVTYNYTDPDTGCPLNASINFTVSANPTSEVSTDITTTCLDGSVTLGAVDFMAGATYNWDFGDATSVALGDEAYTLNWATAGEKTITLTVENGGCASAQTQVTVMVEQPLSQPIIGCDASSLNSVTFGWTPVSGATGYEVLIDGTTTIPLDASATSYLQEGLAEGAAVTAVITAISGNSCPNTVSEMQECFAQECPPVDITIDVATNYCQSDAAVTLTATPIGGVFAIDGTAAATLDPATVGLGTHIITYDYVVDDCNYSDSRTISVSANPTPVISGQLNFCPGGGSTTLTLDDAASYSTVEWSVGGGSESVDISTEGAVIVTVTNDAGCSNEATVIVTESPVQQPEITTTDEPVICTLGQTITLFADEGFNSYIWSVPALDQATLDVSAPGMYSVVVTDGFGCEWTASIEVQEGAITPPAVEVVGSATPTFCTDAGATLSTEGGFASYAWSTGDVTQTIGITTGGEYEVIVSNFAGCTASNTIIVTETPFPTPVITATATDICEGDEVTLSVSETFDTYVWSTGEETQSITVTSPGMYNVAVTTNSCESVTTQEIGLSIEAQPVAAFVADNTAPCFGTEVNFMNMSENALDFTWTFLNDDTGISFSSTESDPVVNFDQAGNYTVTLDVTALCGDATASEIQAAFINVGAGASAEAMVTPEEICPGEEVTLSALGNATLYLWQELTPGTSLNATAGATVTANPLQASEYLLTAMGPDGCEIQDTVSVSVHETCELPNAITPRTQDGFNDTWWIPMAETNTIFVEIYNRWGQKVWSVNGYDNANGWDGTNDGGEALPDATYYYVIDLNDGSDILTGDITILK